MIKILLVIIYIAFISLGLPDAILGSAWPIIHQDLNVPISYAGIVSMIICGGTIISSLLSGKVLRKFGTGKVTTFSVLLTSLGLIGTYFAPSFIWICMLGIPLGLGAGAVDSALNNFVANYFESKHMNWLHCFWGVGATTGPFIMSIWLIRENGWRIGYGTIGIIQAVLVICLFTSLPLWKKFEMCDKNREEVSNNVDVKISTLIKLPGAKPALLAFFCYCGVELTAGIWASTFLVESSNVTVEMAAKGVSLYYLGITVGRFLAGFIAMKFNNTQMIRAGISISIVGSLLLMVKSVVALQIIGIILMGLGFAPIYPAMLHETPNRFSKELSQGIMGIQMATAYVGSTFVPPLFGMMGKLTNYRIFPYFLFILIITMLVATEKVNKNEKICI